MKRILLLALAALLLVGCTKAMATDGPTTTTATKAPGASSAEESNTTQTEATVQKNPIDGTYIYAPSGTNGAYAEYVIDAEAGTLTLNEVNNFGTPYRSDKIAVQTLTEQDGVWLSDDGLSFAPASDGSLLVNGGVATLAREVENTGRTVTKNPIATITMADGKTMTFELHPEIAPQTVASFVTLANSGFYDGLTFHRIYSGFMIQGGDPDGNGTGGPGYSITGEFAANGYVQNDLSHTRGVLSMARSNDYNSAGSQFFVMHADSLFLNAQYAAFGTMLDGFDTLDAIAATPVTTNAFGEKSQPLETVVMQSIRVETFGVDYSSFDKH